MGAAKDYFLQNQQEVGRYIESGAAPQKEQSLIDRLIGEFTNHPNTQQEVPQDLSAYYDSSGAFGGSDYEQLDNPIATGSSETGNKFTESLNKWSQIAGEDFGKMMYAEPGDEFIEAAKNLYRDAIYEPAIGVAATPFAPAPVRAGAGLVALPGFLSDVTGMYSQNLSGEATGEEQGILQAAGNTIKQGLIDPAVNAAGNIISDPAGFAERVGENPLNLWNEAFIPLAPAEIGVRGGRSVYKGVRDFNKDMDALGEDYLNAPDNQMGGNYAEEAAAADRVQRKLAESQQRAAYVEQGIAKQQARDLVNQRLQAIVDREMERNLSEYYDDGAYEAPQSDFDSWFEGMAKQESGGDYNAVNGSTGASGRYQIMPENWDAWAEEAGLERGAEMTPENQDIVARHKMRGYYDEYGPDGALVAWYAGPGNAERWVRGEATDVWGNPWDKPQENGPSIADYVREATEKGQENGLEPLTEKYYNITDEVSDTALTDLTEQKLNYLARDYAERYGENLDLTSMKRSGDGSSWHDSGQAFDIANERLAKDPEARAWLMERAKAYGLYGLDEYTSPSAHATGGHLHFSDHGEPLKGAGRGRGYEPSGYRDDSGIAETPSQTGELTDAFGRDFSDESMGRVQEAMGQLDEQINRLKVERERLENDPEMSPIDRYQKAQRLEDSIARAEEYRSQMEASLQGHMQRMSTGEIGASSGTGRAVGGIGNVARRYRADESARLEAERQQAMADDMARRMAGDVGESSMYRGYEGTANNPYGREVGRYRANEMARAETERQQAMTDDMAQKIGSGYHGENGAATGNGMYGDSQIGNVANRYKAGEKAIAEAEQQQVMADDYSQKIAEAMMNDVGSQIWYDRAPGKQRKKANRRKEIEAAYDEAAKEQGMPEVRRSQQGGQSGAPAKGAYEGDTITNKEYFGRMRELFGPLKVGRTPKGARGIYDGAQDVARADHWGNYDTMWHEIGHRLDARHDLSSMGRNHAQEMDAALQRKYPNGHSYKPNEIVGEGIAEFVKEYVNDEATAKQHFPGFYKDFEKVLEGDKDLANRLKAAQEMARTYRDQPTGAKIAAGIVKNEPKTFREKVDEFRNEFMENWVDDKHGIRKAEREIEKIIGRKLDAEESAYVYSRIAKDRGVSAATELLTGKDPQAVKDALNKIYGGCVKNAVTLPEIMDGLKELAESDVGKDWLKEQGLKDVNEALSVYTVAQRFMEVYDLKYRQPLEKLKQEQAKAEADMKAAEANEAQAKANLKGTKWNTGRAQAQRDFEAAHKAAVEARAAYRKAAHAVEAKEDMGYNMPLEYEEYKSFVDNAPEAMKKAADGVYKLNENIVDIMHHEGILSDEVHKSLKDNHKHYVSLARDFPDDAAIGADSFAPSRSFINVGTPLKKLSEEGSFRDVKDPMQQMAKNIFNALSLVERNKVGVKLTDHANLKGVGGIVEKVEGDAKTSDSSFYVWRKGKKEVYNTTPEIYNALKSMKEEASDSMIRYMAELPARWMRAGAVVYNPQFLLKNLTRDQLTAYLFSEYGYKPFYDLAKGVYHILKEDEIYQEFKTSGALLSTVVNAAKDWSGDILKDAQRTPKEKVFQKLNPLANLEKLSNFIESATRVGLYGKARGKGASILEATMEAREGTLDFGKAGFKGRSVNRYSPFFNAAIQDPVLFMEKFKKNPARMAKRLAPMVMGSLAIYAMIRSDDGVSREYDQLMPYEKNMFWNVPVPKEVCSTGWLRFPKPFGPGFLFASLPERLADLAYGKDKDGHSMKEWAKEFSSSLIPGSLPPLLTAVYEWQSEYSTFRQRDIVPAREKDMDARDQYGPETSTFAKWAGEKTNLSPRKIDNLGQNLFAGAYGGVTNLHDAAVDGRKVKAPYETFKLDPWSSPQSTQEYYDRRKAVQEAHNSEEKKGRRMSREDKRDYERTKNVDKVLQEKNAKLRKAQERYDDEGIHRYKKDIAEFLDRELDKFSKRR